MSHIGQINQISVYFGWIQYMIFFTPSLASSESTFQQPKEKSLGAGPGLVSTEPDLIKRLRMISDIIAILFEEIIKVR